MKAIRTNPWRALRPGVSVGGRSGFSLLEVIVVLALMSILGTIAVESLFVRIVQGQRDENQAALDRYVGAVESSILRTQTVPSASELPGALAEEMGIPSSLVAVNRSGYARIQVGSVLPGGSRLGFGATVCTIELRIGFAGQFAIVDDLLCLKSLAYAWYQPDRLRCNVGDG